MMGGVAVSGLLLCSKQANNPFYVENDTIGIYNLEELCYYLYNYTYMITIDFFNDELIAFCEKEIEQPALAQRIKECLAHKESLKTIILRVLESSSYYDEDEIRRFELTLSYLDSPSVMERLKVRADMMVKSGKLKAALISYSEILKNKEEIMSLQFYARVRSNIGVIYTRLFMYDKAVLYFEKAYEAEPVEEYKDYLICSLLMLKDEDKLSEIAERYGFEYSLISEYKIAFDNVNRIVRSDEKYAEFMERFKYKGKNDLNAHYEIIAETLAEWKEEYRRAMDA